MCFIIIYGVGLFIAAGFYTAYDLNHSNFAIRMVSAPIGVVVLLWPFFLLFTVGVSLSSVLRFLQYLIDVDRYRKVKDSR